MKHNFILLCLAMLVASPILARDKTDVILMKNGDRFTCEIKGLSSNILYVSISYFLAPSPSIGPRSIALKARSYSWSRPRWNSLYR